MFATIRRTTLVLAAAACLGALSLAGSSSAVAQPTATAAPAPSADLTPGRTVKVQFRDFFWSSETTKPGQAPNNIKLGSAVVVGTVWAVTDGYVGISTKSYESGSGGALSSMTHWIPLSTVTKVDTVNSP